MLNLINGHWWREKFTMTDCSDSSGCSILSDALTYLNKLGSNLQQRTASLKLKKVSKSKFKDVDNIIKVTAKILQICELSKKSIDVVEKNLQKYKEAGYRKLCRNPASSSKISEKDQTVIHDGVRIPDKVSLKRYLTCKVKVKRLEKSVHKKYPTYDDYSEEECKALSNTILSSNETDVRTKRPKERADILNELLSAENSICSNDVCNRDYVEKNCDTEEAQEGDNISCLEERTSSTHISEKSDRNGLNSESDEYEIEKLPALDLKVLIKKRKRRNLSSECEGDNDVRKKLKPAQDGTLTETENPILNFASDHDSALNEVKDLDSTLNIASDNDPALDVPSNDDTLLNVTSDNSLSLNVETGNGSILNNSKEDDPSLNCAEDGNKSVCDAVNENSTIGVTDKNGNSSILINSKEHDPSPNCGENGNNLVGDAVNENSTLNDVADKNVNGSILNTLQVDDPSLNCVENRNNPVSNAVNENLTFSDVADENANGSILNKSKEDDPSLNCVKDGNNPVCDTVNENPTLNDKGDDNSNESDTNNEDCAKIAECDIDGQSSVEDESSRHSLKSVEEEKKKTDEHVNSSAPDSVNEGVNGEDTGNLINKEESKTESQKIQLKCIDINKLLKPSLVEKSNDDSKESKRVRRQAKHLRQSRESKNKFSRRKHQSDESDEEIRNKTKSTSDQVLKANKNKRRKGDEDEIEDTSKNLHKYNRKLNTDEGDEMRQRVEEFKPKNFTINSSALPELNQAFLESQNLRRIVDCLGNVIVENIKPKENVHNAKNQLLNDSSSDTTKGSSSSERKKSKKRKKTLESINAKRKLMIMSSSSGTEDELVNNAYQTIKESLQKSSSSNSESEKKVKKENENDISKRKLITSSPGSSSEPDEIESALRTLAMPVVTQKRRSSNSVNGASNSNSISQIDGNDDSDANSENASDCELSDCEMGRSLRRGRGNDSQDSSGKDDVSKASSKKSIGNKREDIKKDLKPGLDSESTETEGSVQSRRSSRSGPSTKGSASKAGDSSAEDRNHPVSGDELSGAGFPNENGDAILGDFAKDDLLEELTSGSDEGNSAEVSQKEKEDENGENGADDGTAEDRKHRNEGDEKSTNGETETPKKKKKKVRNKLLHGRLSESDDSDIDSKDSTRKNTKSPIDLGLDSDDDSEAKRGSDKDKKDKGLSSDSDSSDVFRKVKRRTKKRTESDSSSSKSSLSGPSKRKRRRIKQPKVSSGSDTDSEGNKKTTGRKNIRKVMGRGQLEEATKKAAKEERERVARITERQKLYNNTAFDESGKPDEVVLDKVVLDFDPETKEPLIEVDKGLVKKLKPHQANGIKFMWDACFESVKQIKKDKGSGCILAHCMGLGKTLQVVSLTHTLLTHSKLTKVERVLVVCPLSTVLNWVNEYRMWLEHAESDADINVYEISRYKQNYERSYQLQDWLENGGVCVLGYEMFRNLSADNPKKFRKKLLKSFQDSLVDPGPDLVVCDEGHLLKNEKTSLSQSMNRVKTLRRIVLTGTPLQNNLKEYYCMVQFVKPNLLGKYNEYLNRFVNPITNGQYTDSTEYDIKIMKRRSHVLHKLLDGAVQRRDYGVLAPFLPPKHEYVLFITLTELQIKLYRHYLDNYSRRQHPDRKNSGFLFPDFQSLQRIWTHPLVLKANSERYEIMQQKKKDREEEDSEGSLADFIDDESTTEESTPEESSDEMSDLSDGSRKKGKKKKSPKKNKTKTTSRRGTRANPDQTADKPQEVEVETKAENPTEWWVPLVTEDELEDMRNSNKLLLLFDVLRQCEAIGDKLLVFSQSLYSLDLIEQFLSKIDEATQSGTKEDWLGGHMGSWSPGIDYFRLDGSTSCENRSIWCKNFNKEDNPRARLFLISTRAGGLGINLVAANRVVIFDVSWNPSHDVQSIFRVYRFGQKKPCYVYRFLAMGTMEEKIYERQVTKQAISKRVIDEQQIDRHYAENDLAELYIFTPRPEEPRPVPLLPKDRLFAEMLKIHEDLIYKYHEHDSLLENKEEETLTEEERKAAWEDFENEKNKPPPPPMPQLGMGGMMGVNGNMLAQQSMALAALTNMLRKDYPTLTEQQLANMLPSIMYQADPNMMQKMNAMMGGYAQQPMMNSNMMMSAGSGSGSTGQMQFPSMWQQQMQYQRMQQQQAAQMNRGMKYYAGGLGSRDPVSMALQQQRQREMILAGAGAAASEIPTRGRPRGRPAVPPPSVMSNEVVNLDDSE